jgi:hypothetical protein
MPLLVVARIPVLQTHETSKSQSWYVAILHANSDILRPFDQEHSGKRDHGADHPASTCPVHEVPAPLLLRRRGAVFRKHASPSSQQGYGAGSTCSLPSEGGYQAGHPLEHTEKQ